MEDVEQFFRIHRSLMLFVNRRLKVIDEPIASPEAYGAFPPTARFEVHSALLEHMELIDAFTLENPSKLDEADLEIARSWNHLVSGPFFAFRQLQSHMIFVSDGDPVQVYGVVALFSSFDRVIPPPLPRLIRTSLLPFKERIVYDGLISTHNVTFGGGIKRRLDGDYKEAKATAGIITSLPSDAGSFQPPGMESFPVRSSPKSAARKPRPKAASPSASAPAHDRIVALTDAFCGDRLDEEYAALCRKMAGVLARKRPSPIVRGQPESWASGIVRAIGSVNFLGDPSTPHHMKMTEIDKAFGVSEATGSAKATAIRKLLDLGVADPHWTVPSLMDQNPMAWTIQVNGLIVDARRLPRPLQEDAFRKGLIPWIPADRPGAHSDD